MVLQLFYNSVNCRKLIVMQKIFVHRDEMNFFLVAVQLVFYGPFQTSIVKSCSHICLLQETLFSRTARTELSQQKFVKRRSWDIYF